MGQFAELIVASARRSRSYAERILKGVTAPDFARKARFEDKGRLVVIESNHPAWAFGHLGLYPARVLEMLGLDGSKVAAPAGYEGLFKDGTACQDDPTGKIYPAMESVTAHYFRATGVVLDTVVRLDDKALLAATVEEKYREAFPLVGGRVNFMLNNHVMMHLGQVSAWRRCMGLPPA